MGTDPVKIALISAFDPATVTLAVTLNRIPRYPRARALERSFIHKSSKKVRLSGTNSVGHVENENIPRAFGAPTE